MNLARALKNIGWLSKDISDLGCSVFDGAKQEATDLFAKKDEF